MEYVPNLNTWADLVDRLIVCVNKLAWFENKKREAQRELNQTLNHPDFNWEAKVEQLRYDIVEWDNKSRNECEVRNILKREIDRVLGEVIAAGEYKPLQDNRTFSGPPRTVSDILAEQCEEIGKSTWVKLGR